MSATPDSTQTIERMKVLIAMIDEAHSQALEDYADGYKYGSSANGSVKHLAIELGKLCSLLVKQR